MLAICDRFPAVRPDEVPDMDAGVLGLMHDERIMKGRVAAGA